VNKAFVREPEDTGKHFCPKCATLGEPVGRATLAAHLKADELGSIAATGYFCPSPRCEVAYFDLFDRTVDLKALSAPVYPKDRDAPICGCFGLTEDDIEADLAAGSPARVRPHLERAKSAEAHCETAAANGVSCAAAVQKYYLARYYARQNQ
jgi:hypothetical protein